MWLQIFWLPFLYWFWGFNGRASCTKCFRTFAGLFLIILHSAKLCLLIVHLSCHQSNSPLGHFQVCSLPFSTMQIMPPDGTFVSSSIKFLVTITQILEWLNWNFGIFSNLIPNTQGSCFYGVWLIGNLTLSPSLSPQIYIYVHTHSPAAPA